MYSALLFSVFLAAGPCEQSGAPKAPAEPPALDPAKSYGSLYDWAGGRDNAPLGIGRLKLQGRESPWDWWLRVEIPLYGTPASVPWGWYKNGWILDSDGREAAGTSGMIETEYERMSFVVLEDRPDGWIRLRYGKPFRGQGGVAWTHRCHLEEQGLRFESWEERFLSDEISPLHFRSRVRHALRTNPAESAPRAHWIGEDHDLEPLEIAGEWMRVRVTEPSVYCAGDETRGEAHEGWVRFRSDDKGPWVWYFTRGC